MTGEEQRRFLIRSLADETTDYRGMEIPEDEAQQKRLLRSFMNIRPPKKVSRSYLEVQDAYLSDAVQKRGIVDCQTLEPSKRSDRMYLWQGDITRLKADAIVNAANSALLGCFNPCHSCIDNIIHTYAGVQLRLKCDEIMQAQGHEEPTGKAKITPGYNLPCKYVLHTVGPIISGLLTEADCELLAGCYRSCLELAAEYGLKSVAFCCISTGVFHFPQQRAAEIAVETVEEFLETNGTIRQVIFNVFTDRDLEIYKELLEYGN